MMSEEEQAAVLANVKPTVERLFEEAHRQAAVRATVERVIAEAFASVGDPEPDASPEDLAKRWDAIFKHMWRGFGCNVVPFPEWASGARTASSSAIDGGAA